MISKEKIEGVYKKTKLFVDSGQFELAIKELGSFWTGIGNEPNVESVSEPLRNRLILMCGVLTGWLGSSRQIEGSQEMAKDLICRASDKFEAEGFSDWWAESRGELALCYWREGSFCEARIILQDALDKLSNDVCEIKAVLLLRLVNVEISTYNYENANALLKQAGKLIDSLTSPLLCGKVYFHYALVMRRLSEEENKQEYLYDSLKYYEVSKNYYQKANHRLYEAMVDNNLGYLLCKLNDFDKAHEYLENALSYFSEINDCARMSLVYDNKARVLLAENKLDEAEKNAETAVSIIKRGDEQSSLAEYLTTLGLIQAARGDYINSQNNLVEASEIAYQIGDMEDSGLALLTLIENLSDIISKEELVEYYLRADEILSRTTQKIIINRLNRAAKFLLQLDQDSIDKTENKKSFQSFAGKSSDAKKVLKKAGLLSKTNNFILITGESGTGKETLARQIHQWSERAGNFTSVSCAVFTNSDSAIQLFPDFFINNSLNNSKQKSLFELAGKGTLLLKDIEMLSAADQANLVSILEKNTFETNNSNSSTGMCRIIASSDVNLEELVLKGLFRKDLFYKLSIFEIYIPALRDRKEDIPVIIENLLKKYSANIPETLEKHIYNEIKKMPLNGNGDELRAFLEKAVWNISQGLPPDIAENSKKIKMSKQISIGDWNKFSLRDEIKNYESEIILKALDDAGGKIIKASDFLGISHQNLSALLKNRHKDLTVGLKDRKKRVLVEKTD